MEQNTTNRPLLVFLMVCSTNLHQNRTPLILFAKPLHGVWKDFPLSPEDTYSKVLTDDSEDIESDARVLVERLGLLFLPEYIRREYGDKPFVTVRDMVLWLDWIRQHQPVRP